MDSKPVSCPNCVALIPPENINIMALLAKCASCGHLVQLDGFTPKSSSGWPDQQLPDAIPSCPSGITYDTENTTGLWIRRRWFTPGLFFLLFFCIVWDGFLLFWYTIALFADKKPGGGGDLMMILFPLGHVAVGAGLSYLTLSGFLNSTYVTVGDGEVGIRHRPLPWFGNRRIAMDDLQGIELKASWTNNDRQMLAVCGHHIDGRQIVLLSGLPDDHARYIAWALADALQVPLNTTI